MNYPPDPRDFMTPEDIEELNRKDAYIRAEAEKKNKQYPAQRRRPGKFGASEPRSKFVDWEEEGWFEDFED